MASANLNKVFLIGNLTQDPDLRGVANGQSVCELRMAINRRYITSNGEEQNEVCYVDVSVWGRSATNCRNCLAKGSSVFVEGRLQLDTWEDRNGGGKRSKLRVVAEHVQFLSPRRETDPGAGQYGGNGQYGNPAGGQFTPGYRQNNSYQPGGYGSNYANNYNGAGNYRNNYAQGAMPVNYAPAAGQMADDPADSMPPAMPSPDASGDVAPQQSEDDIPF